MAEGIMVDLWRDFWIRETGTGQQVAQLHDRYMMMMMMMMMMTEGNSIFYNFQYSLTFLSVLVIEPRFLGRPNLSLVPMLTELSCRT